MDRLTEVRIALVKMSHRKCAVRHLPYKTAEEIENTLAALWALKMDLDFKASLVDNAIAHAQAARNDKKAKPRG